MSLLNRFQTFRAQVAGARGLIASAHRSDAAGVPLWNITETHTISHAGFMQFYLAWEAFLEGSLIDYLQGNPSINGNVLTRYALPQSDQHAAEILIGTQKYADYTRPDLVIRLAKLFLLDGEPYKTSLNSITLTLSNLRHIRNAASHLTGTTNAKLDAVASQLLGPPQSNVTVYALITAIDPNSATGDTILELLIKQVDASAHAIVYA